MDTCFASAPEAFWEEFLVLVFDTTPSTSCVCYPSVAGFGMDLADPASSGKYTWFFVFTAPVAELNVVSFTVPLNYWTIAATATVVTSCSSSTDCGGVCVTMSCGGGFFTPGGAYDSVWDSVRPMIGNTPSIPFSTLDVECVCMLNDWINCNDDFCADNYNYSRFMLKDKCRSEKWELYLYGDMTIKVMESRRAEHCGVLRSCSSWCDGKAFLGRVHRYTARVPPPSGRGRGGGDAGSLLPGVLPPELGASHARAWTDTP